MASSTESQIHLTMDEADARGMVIREVNQHEVKNVEDFRKAAEQAEQDKRVLLLVQSPQATMYLTFPLA